MWDQRSHKQATSSHSLFSASQGAAPTHFVKIPICSCTWEVSRYLRIASLREVGRAWSTRPWTCVPTSSPHDFPTWEHPFRSIKTLATAGWGTESTCFTRLVRPLQRDPSQPAMKLTTTALVCLLLVGTWLQDGHSWSREWGWCPLSHLGEGSDVGRHPGVADRAHPTLPASISPAPGRILLEEGEWVGHRARRRTRSLGNHRQLSHSLLQKEALPRPDPADRWRGL